MRKIVFVMSIVALCMFGCSESDDELQIENEVANEIPALDLEKFYSMIHLKNATLNENGVYSKPSGESKNNGNGVNIVAFYSDGGRWRADFPIYDKDDKQTVTHWAHIWFPQNGEDRALVFSETEMMVNYNSHIARMWIYDVGLERITYSNWCEEDASGLFKGRGKTEYASHPNNPNVYWWGPFAPVEADDNYIFHIKATLHPTTWHPCRTDLTESVDFSYTLNGQNGKVKQTSSMR